MASRRRLMTADQAAHILEEEFSELNGSDSDIEIEVRTTSRDTVSSAMCTPARPTRASTSTTCEVLGHAQHDPYLLGIILVATCA